MCIPSHAEQPSYSLHVWCLSMQETCCARPIAYMRVQQLSLAVQTQYVRKFVVLPASTHCCRLSAAFAILPSAQYMLAYSLWLNHWWGGAEARSLSHEWRPVCVSTASGFACCRPIDVLQCLKLRRCVLARRVSPGTCRMMPVPTATAVHL